MYAANPWIAAIAGISVILGVVYLLILIQKWFFGKARSNETLVDLNAGEALAVVPLLIASFVLGFYPAPVASQAGVVAEHLGAAARAQVLALTPALTPEQTPATEAAPAPAAHAPAP
jgi:NADH:ubiquinone oxidoreductase subunit 4 (subunit M)